MSRRPEANDAIIVLCNQPEIHLVEFETIDDDEFLETYYECVKCRAGVNEPPLTKGKGAPK